jgi:type IV secretion system protein VirB9
MRSPAITVAAAWALALGCAICSAAQPANPRSDPRLKEIWYDPNVVVTLPVQRGVVTHVVLDPGESITEVGSGFGSDCGKPESSWCVAVPPGGHHLFIKPKSNAGASNNLAVVTDKRMHAFRLVVLPEGTGQQPVYRLIVKAPVAARTAALAAPPLGLDAQPSPPALPDVPPASPAQLIAERLSAAAVLMNTNYTLA